MEEADIVLFWIPRDKETLPGFTTNIEFGYWLGKVPTKIRLGFPFNAYNMRYIEAKCENNGITCRYELDILIKSIAEEFGK